MNKKNNNALILGIIGGIIVLLFVAIIVLTNMSNNDKMKDNPYGTEDLYQSTIDLLDDENYQNIILPDALKDKIATGETVYAYLFSPECIHCKNFTPTLISVADEYDIEIDQLNVLEFDSEWETYQINSTPSLLVFKDGKEVSRLVGDNPAENVRQFFDSVK